MGQPSSLEAHKLKSQRKLVFLLISEDRGLWCPSSKAVKQNDIFQWATLSLLLGLHQIEQGTPIS